MWIGLSHQSSYSSRILQPQSKGMMEVAPFDLKCPWCYQPSSPLSQNVKAFIATENFLKLAQEL